jgi:hypothetical protein
LPQRFVPPGCLGELEATFLPVSIPATLLFEWVGMVFSAVLAVLALRSFLRPVLRDDRSAAHPRALLTAHGGSHLSWMTTWPGYSRWFTADGTRFVAYRVRLGVAITTSDPVCPPHRLEETVRGFADFATANGWTPCFYSLTAAVRAQGTALGWGALRVAEETVLPLGGLAFTGRKFEDIRTALNHARKQGITAEWISFPRRRWQVKRPTPAPAYVRQPTADCASSAANSVPSRTICTSSEMTITSPPRVPRCGGSPVPSTLHPRCCDRAERRLRNSAAGRAIPVAVYLILVDRLHAYMNPEAAPGPRTAIVTAALILLCAASVAILPLAGAVGAMGVCLAGQTARNTITAHRRECSGPAPDRSAQDAGMPQ